MTEFPIADFSLNNDFVHNVDIVDSKVNLNSINRMNINDIHAKDKNLITKNLINKYEFNFKK